MLSILSYLRSGNYIEAIIAILSRCFVVFCCLPIHELAHGLMADKLGDHTARNQGRLTFNPFAHLNLLGTIMQIPFQLILTILKILKREWRLPHLPVLPPTF